MSDEPFRFAVGDRVEKVGGDYFFQGVVVAAFRKRSGKVRYVVENDYGLLHIFSNDNLVFEGQNAIPGLARYKP